MSPLFGRREQLPPPVYHDQLWDQTNLIWPVERALLAAFPDLEEWKRRPRLEVPRDFKSPDTSGVVFWVPPWWHATADVRKNVVSIIATRLGITDPVASWTANGVHPKVVVRPRQRTPERVVWGQVRDLVVAASPTAPLLGLGVGGAVVDCDLIDDSPHIAVSAGSGGGKSTLVKALVAQNLYHDGVAVVLDFKRSSHRWAFGLPNVLYCKDLPDIHDALVAIGAEAERRNVASDDPDAELGPRVTLVAEEMNATLSRLAFYWENIRVKGDPKTSPAVAALRDVLFMGRSTKLNVIAVAQMLTARAIGGPEARENFATRCLTRYSSNSWKMLAPEAGNPPKRSNVLGRWQVVKGGEAHECQVAYLTDEEARAWASKGAGRLPQLGERDRSITAPDVAKQLRHVVAATAVGLRDVLPLLPGPEMSLAALRKCSERDDRFPEPVGWSGTTRLYDLDSLRGWRRERLAAERAVTG
ncbi:MAG: hypothetical protein ACRDRY_17755 [Pseudonocardiaceae bacterium]